MCNRHGVKDEILNKTCNDRCISASKSMLSDNSSWNENSVTSLPDDTDNEKQFTIFFLREDFRNLLVEKVYKR